MRERELFKAFLDKKYFVKSLIIFKKTEVMELIFYKAVISNKHLCFQFTFGTDYE